MTIKNRIDKTKRYLDKLTSSQYCPVDVHWVINSITWLHKYKHIDENQMKEFTDNVMMYFEIERMK